MSLDLPFGGSALGCMAAPSVYALQDDPKTHGGGHNRNDLAFRYIHVTIMTGLVDGVASNLG
jgi:hypothetical protein